LNGPDNNRFGGGAGGTFLHPLVLVLMVLACILILLLPRKYVMIPFTILVILVPIGQQVYLAGFHFYADRILIMFGCIRIAFTKLTSEDKIIPWGYNGIDKLYYASTLFGAVATVLLFREFQAFTNQVGVLWDGIGGYIVVRYMIQDKEDIARFIKILAGCMVIIAGAMLNELYRGQNPFGIITGNYAVTIRDGAIRAHGPIFGPIVAGTFGATALCMFVWLLSTGKSRGLAIVGIISCTIVTYTSQSSTPLLAYTAAVIGMSMWFFRKQMRIIRWGIALGLIALHMIMKAPVWFIISHVDLVAGNSGFHRAVIIDGLVKHFSEWWLVGVKSTKYWGWDMWDQANQFVGVGENGGLLTLICFIWMISRSFGRIGLARKAVQGDKKKEWELYLLGAALFAYVVSFFGTSFGNGPEVFPWYALFAMIAVVSTPALQGSTVTVPRLSEAKSPFRFKYARPAITARTQTPRSAQ
jgi:hypothetical protein